MKTTVSTVLEIFVGGTGTTKCRAFGLVATLPRPLLWGRVRRMIRPTRGAWTCCVCREGPRCPFVRVFGDGLSTCSGGLRDGPVDLFGYVTFRCLSLSSLTLVRESLVLCYWTLCPSGSPVTQTPAEGSPGSTHSTGSEGRWRPLLGVQGRLQETCTLPKIPKGIRVDH